VHVRALALCAIWICVAGATNRQYVRPCSTLWPPYGSLAILAWLSISCNHQTEDRLLPRKNKGLAPRNVP